MKINPTPDDFTPSMVAGCNAALDAGIFFDWEFCAYVTKHMGRPGFEPHLMRVVTIPAGIDFSERRALVNAAESEVTAAPRGHYVVFENHHSGMVQFSFFASDGSGSESVGGRYNSYDAMPQPGQVTDAVVGYEIYSCRKVLEQQRASKKSKEAIARYGIRPGFTMTGDFRLGGDKFSSFTVESISDAGLIAIVAAKRGSKSRFMAHLSGDRLAEIVGLEIRMAEAMTAADSLF